MARIMSWLATAALVAAVSAVHAGAQEASQPAATVAQPAAEGAAPQAPVAGAVAQSAAERGEAVASTGEDSAQAGSEESELEEVHREHFPLLMPQRLNWTFDGPFGRYDPQQLQRGLQVYREVCSSCHSMNLVALRHLTDTSGPHFSEEEVKALAASYEVTEATPNDAGDYVQRPGKPTDYFPAPFPNEQAARASNNGAYPPDFSLLAKARSVSHGGIWFLLDLVTQYQEDGPNYIYSLLTGYQEPPAGREIPEGQYYNPYFLSGASLSMPPPLSDGQISYFQNTDENQDNNVPETVDQYARDVSAFMMWAAEPYLPERKSLGLVVFVFLALFAGLLWYTKRKVWSDVPH